MKRKLIVLSTMVLFFFLLTRISHSQTKLSFKAIGGYGNMSPGDLNAVISSWDALFIDIADLTGYTKEGATEKINWDFEFEGEFIVNLTKNIGIGIGTGYIQRKKDSNSSLKVDTLGTITLNLEPKITATPIRLSVYYFYPLASQMNIFFNGGIGYYFGKIALSLKTEESSLVLGYTYWNKMDYEVKDNGIGFHGGIGFEYNIVKNIAFFVEGSGRYAKLKDWEGDVTFTNSGGDTEKKSGTFWYYESEYLFFSKYYSNAEIEEGKPTDPGFRNIRKFECDLSGLSIKAGLRIKF